VLAAFCSVVLLLQNAGGGLVCAADDRRRAGVHFATIFGPTRGALRAEGTLDRQRAQTTGETSGVLWKEGEEERGGEEIIIVGRRAGFNGAPRRLLLRKS
jgi:hypothetical protein